MNLTLDLDLGAASSMSSAPDPDEQPARFLDDSPPSFSGGEDVYDIVAELHPHGGPATHMYWVRNGVDDEPEEVIPPSRGFSLTEALGESDSGNTYTLMARNANAVPPQTEYAASHTAIFTYEEAPQYNKPQYNNQYS